VYHTLSKGVHMDHFSRLRRSAQLVHPLVRHTHVSMDQRRERREATGRMQLNTTAHITRPMDEVFAVVCDLRLHWRWERGTGCCRQVFGPGPLRGALYEVQVRSWLGGRPHTEDVELEDFSPPRQVGWRRQGMHRVIELRYELVPDGAGTRVHRRETVTWERRPPLLAIVRRAMDVGRQREMRRLTRLLESGTPGAETTS
jgi:hypothetical protein